MTFSSPRSHRLFLLLLYSAVPLAVGAPPAGGQELPWLQKGRVRLDFAPSFWAWDQRYGTWNDPSGAPVSEVEPLGLDLTADPLGYPTLPYLASLEESLRGALEDDTYRVRLGASRAVVEQSRLVFPFRLELGVLDWLTVGAMVPFVRPRTELTFALQADSLTADVGPVPSAISFLATFGSAVAAAESQNPGNPSVVGARTFLDLLTAAYDHGSVFPAAGSSTGILLQGRLDEIRQALAGEGFTGVPETLPLAEAYLDQEGFQSLLTSGAMQAYPLDDWTTPWALGDIEITAAVRIIHHGFDPDSLGRLPFFRAQFGVGGLVRLGTGQQEDPARFLDTGPGDGQMDMEGSLFGLVQLGSRIGGWGHLRFGVQQEGPVVRRIASPTEILPQVSRTAGLSWTPGNYMDLQLNPRFYFTPEMTFGLRYRYWSKGEDQYTLSSMDPENPAAYDYPSPRYLNYETREILQEIGISATFSTLAAHARGESSIPLQVRFSYLRPLSGEGGRTPKGGRVEAGVSLYRAIWGRGPGPSEEATSGNR